MNLLTDLWDLESAMEEENESEWRRVVVRQARLALKAAKTLAGAVIAGDANVERDARMLWDALTEEQR
jgi:hypothetical protein